MKTWVVGLSISLFLSISCVCSAQQVELYFDFSKPHVLSEWQGKSRDNVYLLQEPVSCLAIEAPPDAAAGSVVIQRRLPVEQLRGTKVLVEAQAKADGVSKPPNPWNGVKCMIHVVTPEGDLWRQQNSVYGTFDWQLLRFVAEIPQNSREAWLVLGLERASGKVFFRWVRLRVIARRRPRPAAPSTRPVYKGHNLPRLRGTMIGPRVGAEDLLELGLQWKANHVRWQLIWGGFPHSPADKASVAEYRRWLESELDRLDQLLPVCRRAGLMVLIDMHTPPGGRNERSECRIFHSAEYQKAFVDFWQEIARRYRDEKIVWGYDLVNEPVEGVVGEGLMNWQQLAEHTAREIRKIDSEHAIIVEPAPWGSPESLEWLYPLDVPGVVYSVHMYKPHKFTHQGIYGNPMGIEYPGEIDGRYYDKEALRGLLKPVVEFQKDYNVHIYIGEFSAIRWAPGKSAYNYLRDCIELFEEYGWDWAYHAFREWDGWSVEHGPDRQNRQPVPWTTDRKRLLLEYFSKNLKPQF